jgi:hypothetical protein
MSWRCFPKEQVKLWKTMHKPSKQYTHQCIAPTPNASGHESKGGAVRAAACLMYLLCLPANYADCPSSKGPELWLPLVSQRFPTSPAMFCFISVVAADNPVVFSAVLVRLTKGCNIKESGFSTSDLPSSP